MILINSHEHQENRLHCGKIIKRLGEVILGLLDTHGQPGRICVRSPAQRSLPPRKSDPSSNTATHLWAGLTMEQDWEGAREACRSHLRVSEHLVVWSGAVQQFRLAGDRTLYIRTEPSDNSVLVGWEGCCPKASWCTFTHSSVQNRVAGTHSPTSKIRRIRPS